MLAYREQFQRLLPMRQSYKSTIVNLVKAFLSNKKYYILIFILALLLRNIFLLLFIPVPLLYRKHKARQRILDLEKDLVIFSLMLVSGLRSGMDLISAIININKNLADNSMLVEINQRLVSDISSGISEREAFKNYAIDINHPDLDLLRLSMLTSKIQGGSLVPALRRFTEALRTRQSMRRKIKTAIALQKVSAFGILLCCLFILAFQYFAQRESLVICWDSELGRSGLILSFTLILSGLLWMMFLSRERI